MNRTVGVWSRHWRDLGPVAGPLKCMDDFKCLLMRVEIYLFFLGIGYQPVDVRASCIFLLSVIRTLFILCSFFLYLSIVCNPYPFHSVFILPKAFMLNQVIMMNINFFFCWCNFIFVGTGAFGGSLEGAQIEQISCRILMMLFILYLIFYLFILEERWFSAASGSLYILIILANIYTLVSAWKLVI